MVGVVIGGLIAGVSSYLIERRRDLLEEQRDQKVRFNAAKQAARVVDAELEQAERSAKIAVERREWWAREIGPIEVGSWAQYRAILASELSLDNWRLIASAFGFIHGINSAWAIAFREDPWRQATINLNPPRGLPMSEDDQKKIPYGIGWISKARQSLANLLSDDQER